MRTDVKETAPRRGESRKDFFKHHIPRKPAVSREDPKGFLRRMSAALRQQQAAVPQQQTPGVVPEH